MNICFITNELHPFAPGGIGRLMYNFAVQNRDRKTNRRNFYFLISSLDLPNYEMLAEYFEEHDLGTVIATPTEFSYLGEQESRLFHCIPNEYSGPSFVRKSIEYYNGLLYLEARYGIQLDLIEFPDYGGLGFATLAAKHAGLAFRNTMITVRLHSTGGIIHDAEPFYHRKGKGELSFFELERQCLEQAELVVSHLPVITTANQNFYSFKSTWQKKVIHEFPPIFLEGDEIFDSKADEATRDFIFSSRLQPFKRPDLFIKAAVIFLDCNPIYEGRFYVVSYGWDKAYINWLQNLVPKQYKDCIHFIFNAEASLRNKLLQNSIVVIPSNYESLCLFAYESALRGNKLILNRQCLAFGEAPYWQEGENCLKFDGTADDLARAYERALISPQPTPKPLPESLCYWHQEKKTKATKRKPRHQGELAIITYGFWSLAHANECLFALSPIANDPRFSFHFVMCHDDESALPLEFPSHIKLHFAPWYTPNPDYFKTLLSEIKADYFAFLPPTSQVSVEFYETACESLDQMTDIDIVTSHVRVLTNEDVASQKWQEGNRDDYGGEGYAKISLGSAPTVAKSELHVVSECSCWRTSSIDLSHIDEEAAEHFLSVMLNKAVQDGARVLVIPKLMITELPAVVTARYLLKETVLDSL